MDAENVAVQVFQFDLTAYGQAPEAAGGLEPGNPRSAVFCLRPCRAKVLKLKLQLLPKHKPRNGIAATELQVSLHPSLPDLAQSSMPHHAPSTMNLEDNRTANWTETSPRKGRSWTGSLSQREHEVEIANGTSSTSLMVSGPLQACLLDPLFIMTLLGFHRQRVCFV